MSGWGDEDPEEMQAHVEFAGHDDWEIERLQEQWPKEDEEAEERQKQQEEEVEWSTQK